MSAKPPEYEQHPGLELLGQRIYWPRTKQATITAVSLIMGICVVVYTVVALGRPENLGAVATMISAGTYEQNGRPTGITASTIYRFWTPSPETKKDIAKSLGIPSFENPPKDKIPAYYWCSDDESEVDKFIEILDMHNIMGLSIVPSKGLGTSHKIKRGYIWEVTINREHPISKKTFINLYASHWKREKDIYLEELHVSTEHTEPAK